MGSGWGENVYGCGVESKYSCVMMLDSMAILVLKCILEVILC